MTKRKLNPKPQGRQNAFSGAKFDFLKSFGDEWVESSDHAGLYTRITKNFFLRFGYDLELVENPPDGFVVSTEINPSLSIEDRLAEGARRDDLYKTFREKLGNWFRHRYNPQKSNQSTINKIIDRVTSNSTSKPRKKALINVYTRLYRDKLKPQFDAMWATVQDTVDASDRMKMWNDFTHASWEKESEEVKALVLQQAEKEYAEAMDAWKKNSAEFTGTAEGYDDAWRTAATVLPAFSDALSHWLGASILIVSVSPMCNKDGDVEMTMQSAQSDTSKGMTKKIMAEFDSDGFNKFHKMVLKYGEAYFPPEEYLRRKKQQTDKTEIDEFDEAMTMIDEKSESDGDEPSESGSGPSLAPITNEQVITSVPDSEPRLAPPVLPLLENPVSVIQPNPASIPIISGNDLGASFPSAQPPLSSPGDEYDFSGLNIDWSILQGVPELPQPTNQPTLTGGFQNFVPSASQSIDQPILPGTSANETYASGNTDWLNSLITSGKCALDPLNLFAPAPDDMPLLDQLGPYISPPLARPDLGSAGLLSTTWSHTSENAPSRDLANTGAPTAIPPPTSEVIPQSSPLASPLQEAPASSLSSTQLSSAPKLAAAGVSATPATPLICPPQVAPTPLLGSTHLSFVPEPAAAGISTAPQVAPTASLGSTHLFSVPEPPAAGVSATPATPLICPPQVAPTEILGSAHLSSVPELAVIGVSAKPATPIICPPQMPSTEQLADEGNQGDVITNDGQGKASTVHDQIPSTEQPNPAHTPTAPVPSVSLEILSTEPLTDMGNQGNTTTNNGDTAPPAKTRGKGRKRKSNATPGEEGDTAPAAKKPARMKKAAGPPAEKTATRGRGEVGSGEKKAISEKGGNEANAAPTTRSGRAVKPPKHLEENS